VRVAYQPTYRLTYHALVALKAPLQCVDLLIHEVQVSRQVAECDYIELVTILTVHTPKLLSVLDVFGPADD